jgi:MATE family multidrug resistance protein
VIASIRHEARAQLRLSGPLITAHLAQIGMMFFDTVMVGNVGALDLAAVAMGASLWNPQFLFTVGVLMATGTLIAHHHGAGERREIGRLVRQSLWLSLFISVPVILALNHMTGFMHWLNVAPEIIPGTQDYLWALSWGVAPIFAFTSLRFVCDGTSFTRPIMVIGLLGLGLNVVFNYLLIYGKMGFPALGAQGCGLATALVFWVMLGCLVWHLARNARYRPYRVLECFELPSWRRLRPLIALGLPIGLSILAESSIFAAIALILGVFGANVVAGHQIALNVASLSFMLPLSWSMAITVRVGHAMGRRNPLEARFIAKTGIAICTLIMGGMAVLIFTLARPIAAVYTEDAAVVEIAVTLLVFAALFQISDGLQVSANGALRGLKDTKIPMVMTVLAYWLIGLPLGYVLCMSWELGASGLWIGLIVGLSVAAVLLSGRFHFVMRKHVERIDCPGE